VTVDDAKLRGLKDIIAAYLDGRLRGEEAASLAIAGYAAFEEILPNEGPVSARLFIRAYWAIRHLAEPPQYRTRTEEISYLLGCLDAPDTYSEEVANSFYRPPR
jgi:hypothetical protein